MLSWKALINLMEYCYSSILGSMAVYYSDLLTSKPEPGRTYLKTVSENYIVEPDDYPEITMGE